MRRLLADAEAQGAEAVYNLGDMVGYGPDPQAVVDMVRSRQIPSILGNHELGLIKPSYLEWFNPQAKQALIMSGGLLSPETLDYFRSLPTHLVVDGLRLVHGCPPDSPTTYLFELELDELARVLGRLEEGVCFAGHSHELGLYSLTEGHLANRPLGRGVHSLAGPGPHLINVGSVGQPRDGDPHAKYVLHDHEASTVEVRFVPYDIKATVKKLTERGFPAFLAHRLGEPSW